MRRERVVGQAADHRVVAPLEIHLRDRALMERDLGTPCLKDMGAKVLTEGGVQFNHIQMIAFTEVSDQRPGKDSGAWPDFEPAPGAIPASSRSSDGPGQRP